jgi:Saccharopine dehydrogenase NADP binding domain
MSARVRVVVFGAGGELGARVCRLVARVEGAEIVGVSRSARGPAGVAMQRGDVTDAAGIAQLLRPRDLVVNCVGPFHYDPAPLVAACVVAAAHYCDLADDVGFAERAREAARRSGALAAGVLACTGASTVPGLAGLLAGAFAGSPRAHEIARVSAYLSVGSGNPVSAGLLASLLAPLGRALPDGTRCFGELRALRAGDGRTLRFGAYPAAFAEGVVSIGARAVPVSLHFGFDRAALTTLLALLAPALARLPKRGVARLARGLLPFARVVRVFGTPSGLLALVAEDVAGRELARLELAARAHGLDIPAAPPAWIAARLARGESLPPGAAELADVVALPDAVGWLRANGDRTLSSTPPELLPS